MVQVRSSCGTKSPGPNFVQLKTMDNRARGGPDGDRSPQIQVKPGADHSHKIQGSLRGRPESPGPGEVQEATTLTRSR